jgi:hypothetical protein
MPGGKGDCCQVIVLVISQRPGFLVDCAQANTTTANKQHPNVIQTRVLRIDSSNSMAQAHGPARSNFTRARQPRERRIC